MTATIRRYLSKIRQRDSATQLTTNRTGIRDRAKAYWGYFADPAVGLHGTLQSRIYNIGSRYGSRVCGARDAGVALISFVSEVKFGVVAVVMWVWRKAKPRLVVEF